jgi:predicted GIY-YIG superfamily endonuclease
MRDLIKSIIKNYIQEQRIKWTDDMLRGVASKYKTKKDFYTNDPNAYKVARDRGMLPELTKDMVDIKKGYRGSNKYNKEDIKKIALNYSNKKDFAKNEPNVVHIARYFNWYDEITQHMSNLRNEWPKEKVWEIALRYDILKDFIKNENGAYSAAHRNGWLDEITKHMQPSGSRYKRKIYVFEFPDNSAYIGLTYDETRRQKSHNEDIKSAVFNHIKNTGLEPKFKILTPDFISAEDARDKEREYISKYKSDGWNILNKARGGSLGGSHSQDWNFEKIYEIAKQFNNRTEFCKRASMACQMARKFGIFDEVTNHMEIIQEPWDYNKIKQEALKYNDFQDFRKKSKAYQPAKLRKILDDVTSHMSNRRLPWTKERFLSTIKKYDSYTEFRKNEPSAFTVASRSGYIPNIKSYYENPTEDFIF